MFGSRQWEIKDGIATNYYKTGSSYKITLKEAEALIEFITFIPQLNGYHFTFDEGGKGTELKPFLMSRCNIGFGCCRDTWEKVLEFKTILEKSKK